MVVLVLYLKWWLQGFYLILQQVLQKSSFIEARLDAQAPAPSDILRHLTEWFSMFDSRRGGFEIFKEHLWRLKSSLLSAPWAKHYTATQMIAEWNLFVAAAMDQAKEAVFYERSLSKQLSKEKEAKHEMTLLNIQRPELSLVYDDMASEDQLSPDSFARRYYSQIQSRSKNLKGRQPDRYFEFSWMPKAPKCLPDWVH